MNDVAVTIGDPKAPQRSAADATASVWVGASAGTGKTKVLTDRVLTLLLAETRPERIVCLTFTKAAAAEMHGRITDRLACWATASPAALDGELFDLLGRRPDDERRALARRLFARVLDTPGGLNIQTIHAFCQSMLGRFPLEAGVAPHFSVIDDRDAGELLRAARDAVLRRVLADGGALADALDVLTPYVAETGFAALIAALNQDRRRLRSLIERCGSLDGAIAAMRDRLGLGPDERAAAVRAAAAADGAFDAAGLTRTVEALLGGKTTDERCGRIVRDWLTRDADGRAAGFESYARAFLKSDEPPAVKARLLTNGCGAAAPGIREVLEREAERVLRTTLRLRAAVTAEATEALLRLGHTLLESYAAAKRTRSLLDYDDLIHDAGRLLNAAGAVPWVLYKLDGGIDHVLIDEAQDTSPEQWQVIRALTEEFFPADGAPDRARTVFAVGDVKQSIFSFQGADPDQFLVNRDWFGERVRAAGAQWRPVDLTVSFRSTRAVLAAVDAVFDGSAADGVALDGQPILHQAWRQLDGGSVEIWPPIAPRPVEEPEPWTPPVASVPVDAPELRLAGVVARRIARMLVDEEHLASQARPIRAGDVMVLIRRRTPFLEELVRKLKSLDVPVAGVDRMLLLEQIAVMDLVALGHVALLPTDDLTLASVLKSPLIGLDEDRLFDLAHGRPHRRLWRTLATRAGDDPGYAAAFRQLSEVLAMADAVPPAEFYAQVLGRMGGRRRLVGRLGQDADEAIGEFLQLTLAYERNHLPSLQGFLHWFETGTAEVKRDMDHGEPQAVRIMTVHGAKGLQAPIVFLPDTMQVPQTRSSEFLWPEDGDEIVLWPPRREYVEPVAEDALRRRRTREMQEYRRLLYVAMTRAKDRLIVCGWRAGRREGEECWYHLVRDGLERARDRLGLKTIADPFLAADPEFGETTPVLRLSYPQETEPTPPSPHAWPPVPPLPAWARRPAPAEPAGGRPLAPSRAQGEAPARPPLTEDGASLRRGLLVHRLLENLPSLPAEARADAARRWLARPAHRLDAAARADIARTALAVLDDPDLAPLFGPDSLVEVPFTATLAGRTISGRLDRLHVAGEAVSVLDYKTDRTVPAAAGAVPAAYLAQMAAYRSVLRQIYPGRRIRCRLLWTAVPKVMDLPDDLLDRHAP